MGKGKEGKGLGRKEDKEGRGRMGESRGGKEDGMWMKMGKWRMTGKRRKEGECMGKSLTVSRLYSRLNRFFMKLFSTKDMSAVKCCQQMFQVDLPSD